LNPDDLVKDEKEPVGKLDVRMHRIITHYDESRTIRNRLEHDWARDQKIVKGIPIYAENPRSNVRKRPKMRFRKVWSSTVRILSSLWQAFLSDKQKFTIKGFDEEKDFRAAKVLEIMTRYRLNWLFRRRDGFTKLLWALNEAITPGLSVMKVHWKFNEEQEIDEPAFTNYPLEQVALDWQAPTFQESRYVYLENFLTKEQMEDLGYENIDEASPISVPTLPLRDVRYHDSVDPQNARGNSQQGNYTNGSVGSAYPAPGTADGDTLKDFLQARYRVLECWERRKGKIWLSVVNPEGRTWLKKPIVSPYGSLYPVAVGSLLLEPHKLVPESIISPMAGPQEDLNMNINLRKDNQLLAMMGGWSVDKFGGVDTQSLANLRPGFIVRRNPGQGLIEPLKLPDVTQSSYAEASIDEGMIEEGMGIPPIKQGTASSSKTGVTALNLQEANAKESLFVATVAETLFRQIIYLLAYEIQLFETDEKIFRVANDNARTELNLKPEQHDNVFDIAFDMDLVIDVGLNEASRAIELQRQFMFIDRALQSNQAITLMLQAGIKVDNPQMVDVSQFLKPIAKKLGIDNFQESLINLQAPEPEQEEQTGGPIGQSVAGANAPQPNARPADQADQGEFQAFLSQLGQK